MTYMYLINTLLINLREMWLNVAYLNFLATQHRLLVDNEDIKIYFIFIYFYVEVLLQKMYCIV